MSAIAVLGAGAWGTALGVALARSSRRVTLWARDRAQAGAIARARRNLRYLPEVELAESMAVTADLAAALDGAELLLAATPVAGLRELLGRLCAQRAATPLVWLCKGFEQGSGRLPHQIVEEALGPEAASGALSGPSFALEVARGLPCALTLAARDAEFARRAAALLHGGRLRIYYSADLIGVEIGGAVKNVMAIAVGICDGLELGQNARAALITRGLAEISRMALRMGGNPLTLSGLSGMGDLVLTCTGELSRNRTVGIQLGKGRALQEILGEMKQVVEGVKTAKSAKDLSKKIGVEMPICDQIYAILYEGKNPKAAVLELMTRQPKAEI